MDKEKFLEWLGEIGREARRNPENMSKEKDEKGPREVTTLVVNLKTSKNLQLPAPLPSVLTVPDEPNGEKSLLKCPHCLAVVEGVSQLKSHMKIHMRSSVFSDLL